MTYILIFIAAMCSYTAGYLLGRKDARELERKEAIFAGVGYYRTNPETGKTWFVYGTKP